MSDLVGKPRLMFLAHRIPYPPNKGDKIRSFHLLKYLAEHFDIYLGTFVDDPDDWQYCAVVRRYCADAFFVERKPTWHKLLSARGLVTGEALSVAYYRSAAMQEWLDQVVRREGIERALLFCSPMAQFLAPGTIADQLIKRRVIDFVDLDSEKWRQYAQQRRGPMRWLYSREATRLLAAEVSAAGQSSSTYFVSAQEAVLFQERAPNCSAAVGYFQNGVDTEYFKPDPALLRPYPVGTRALVFTGAMDYLPNIDAVTVFANAIFPQLRSSYPDLEFWIVGGKPSKVVRDLADKPGVHVTGRVADVRPFVQHAIAAVAPMTIARGVQNKVLEALAMGKPVIASPQAMEGIVHELFPNTFVVSSSDEWTEAIASVVKIIDRPLPASARGVASTEQTLSWEQNLEPLFEALK